MLTPNRGGPSFLRWSSCLIVVLVDDNFNRPGPPPQNKCAQYNLRFQSADGGVYLELKEMAVSYFFWLLKNPVFAPEVSVGDDYDRLWALVLLSAALVRFGMTNHKI